MTSQIASGKREEIRHQVESVVRLRVELYRELTDTLDPPPRARRIDISKRLSELNQEINQLERDADKLGMGYAEFEELRRSCISAAERRKSS